MSFYLDDEKEIELYREFIMKYAKEYDPLILQCLAFDFSDRVGKKKDIAAPVRSFLNLDNEKNDRYKGFFKFLKDNFDMTSDVLEIGCGTFPVLAHYVDNYQTSNKMGTIEAFDPLLQINSLGNIILNKRNFNEGDEISNKSFAYAFALKGYYEEFITIMNKNKKPFCLGLSMYKKDEFNSYEDYYNYLFDYAVKTNVNDNYSIEMMYLDDSYGYEFPIIVKK